MYIICVICTERENFSLNVLTAVGQSSIHLLDKENKVTQSNNGIVFPSLNTHLVCPCTPLERHLLHVISVVFGNAARFNKRCNQLILNSPELR